MKKAYHEKSNPKSIHNETGFQGWNKITLNRLSEKYGSPPASNLDPPVFRLSTRMELLSLSAIYASVKSTKDHKGSNNGWTSP